MTKLLTAFSQAHDYQVHIPSRWFVEQNLDLIESVKFLEMAREQKTSFYEAYARDAKLRLEKVLSLHDPYHANVRLTYQHFPGCHNLGSDFAYLNFTSVMHYDTLNGFLRKVFTPASAEEPRAQDRVNPGFALTFDISDYDLDF